MKKYLNGAAGIAIAASLALSPAYAQTLPGAAGQTGIVPPQVQSIGPNDLFQDVVGGFAQAQSYWANISTLSGTVGIGFQNDFLIGGRADDNLWQVGTTGASVTTAVTYGGPDMWAYWSGANTAMTVSKASTAAALPAGSANTFRMQKTAAATGTVQMCMAQEISSKNSYYLQGKVAEVDFNVYTGANFSGSGMTAYIVTGTSTDEGTVNLAFGLNGGGGGSSAWTGQANATAAVIPLGAVSTAYRVAAVGNIPTNATEVAVALCYTPVGTAGTTDALYFDNIELREKGTLSNFANATAGYVMNGATISASLNGGSAQQYATIPGYYRRLAEEEAKDQYAYYYRVNEVDTAGVVQGPVGYYDTTTTCSINFALPAPMYKTPTLDETTTSISTTTFQISPTSVAPVVLAGTGSSGAILQVGTAPSAPFTSASVSFKTTTETHYIACTLISTASGAGWFGFNARL